MDVPDRAGPVIERWFRRSARRFPWRVTPRDPYLSFVSEFMLQQTQAARVAVRIGAFLKRFPGFRPLASAPEAGVVSAWAGLGYYRRARLLHAAARAVMERHGATLPASIDDLRALPGVGPYTAGALASIVFGLPEPAIDGNAVRVLARLAGRRGGALRSTPWARGQARRLAGNSRRPGALAEGLMELGATTCTPRAPRCGRCPLRALCVARREGTQAVIPSPRRAPAKRVIHAASVVALDRRGRVLVERRAATGLWPGLWQAPTIESDSRISRARVESWFGAGRLVRIGSLERTLSHRLVRFTVYRACGPVRARPRRRYADAGSLRALGLSSAQIAAFELAGVRVS